MPNPIKIGIEETKQVVDFAISLGHAWDASMEDDKITLSDIVNFMPALLKLFPALEGIDQVPMEFDAIDPEQIAELKEYVTGQLDLQDDEVELFIEDAFKIALDIFILLKVYFGKPSENGNVVNGEETTTNIS